MNETEQSEWATYLERLITKDREFAQAIIVAAQLGVADFTKDGPMPIADLAELTETHEPSLYRLMRYLAGRGIFAENDEARFSTTEFAEPLRADHPQSIRRSALWNGNEAYVRTWGDLSYSVHTGQPAFEHVYGKPFFDYLAEEPDLAQIFSDVMTTSSMNEGAAIIDGHDFSGYQKIVDVGGAHGALLALILDRHPGPGAVLFDAPEVIAAAHGSIDKHVALGRLQKEGGNFFEAVTRDGDAYILKFILHDWDDERAIAILRNCRSAMAANGRVLIIEMVVAEGDAGLAAKDLDITMLLFLHGRERTEREYRDLLHRADLRLVQTMPTASPFSIIEAVPLSDA